MEQCGSSKSFVQAPSRRARRVERCACGRIRASAPLTVRGNFLLLRHVLEVTGYAQYSCIMSILGRLPLTLVVG